MKFNYPQGATQLDLNEMEGLIPEHIHLQKELDEYEQINISEADLWFFQRKFSLEKILQLDFMQKVHKKMFNNTWKWAGVFRQTMKNIGVPIYQITTCLQDLLADVQCQIKHQTYKVDEIAFRFHHRLVKIHLFPNGNGRHARLVTDLLLVNLNQSRFTWGKNSMLPTKAIRLNYISALQAADMGNYDLLKIFVRS